MFPKRIRNSLFSWLKNPPIKPEFKFLQFFISWVETVKIVLIYMDNPFFLYHDKFFQLHCAFQMKLWTKYVTAPNQEKKTPTTIVSVRTLPVCYCRTYLYICICWRKNAYMELKFTLKMSIKTYGVNSNYILDYQKTCEHSTKLRWINFYWK